MVPPPATQSFEISREKEKTEFKRPLIIPIFIPHMGCPHQCLFCNQSTITGATENLPTAKSISREIERYLSFRCEARRSFTEVSFYGGNFLGLAPDLIVNLLTHVSPYVQRGDISGIRFSTRPDTIDSKRLKLIAPFPITTVELGVQSMNDEVLKISRRGHFVSDTLKAITLLKGTNCKIGLQFMLGLPGETTPSLLASAERTAALNPDFIRIYPTLVLAGSPLAKWYQNGKYSPLGLPEAIEQTKKVFLIFKEKDIPVIRMGLQASTELSQKDTVLAGPYHPAFGHMVWSSLYLDAARRLLSKQTSKRGSLQFFAHPKEISKVHGLNNINLTCLTREFKLGKVKVIGDPIFPKGTLALENGIEITAY